MSHICLHLSSDLEIVQHFEYWIVSFFFFLLIFWKNSRFSMWPQSSGPCCILNQTSLLSYRSQWVCRTCTVIQREIQRGEIIFTLTSYSSKWMFFFFFSIDTTQWMSQQDRGNVSGSITRVKTDVFSRIDIWSSIRHCHKVTHTSVGCQSDDRGAKMQHNETKILTITLYCFLFAELFSCLFLIYNFPSFFLHDLLYVCNLMWAECI